MFEPATKEPLNTPVPSSVLNTEPLTIPLPSVIWVEPLITPLGNESTTWAELLIVPAGVEPPPLAEDDIIKLLPSWFIVTFVPATSEPLNIPLPSVIWDEPLIVPLGSCELPLITPLGSDEITCAEDDIVPLGISVCEPDVNPKAVIWAEPLIVPAGTEPPLADDDIIKSLPDWLIVIFVPATKEPLNTPVPSKVRTTLPLTTLVPSKFLNTEPLTTPVPSKVVITEPETIPLPSVIWVELLINPLGSCELPLITPLGSWLTIEPLKTPVPSKVRNTEPDTKPLGMFCRFVFQSAPLPLADIPVILKSTDELNEEKVEPLIIPLGNWSTIEPLKIPLPSVICTDDETKPLGSWELPLIIPLGNCVDEEINPLGMPLNSLHDEAPPPEPVGMVTVFPFVIVNWSPLIESVWVSEPVPSVAFSNDTNLESNEDENAENPVVCEIVIWEEPLTRPVPPNVSCEPSPIKEPLKEPDTPLAPVKLTEPESTWKSPCMTEAVTTPSICLLWIKLPLSTHYLSFYWKICIYN